jgi:hypothetical protein
MRVVTPDVSEEYASDLMVGSMIWTIQYSDTSIDAS